MSGISKKAIFILKSGILTVLPILLLNACTGSSVNAGSGGLTEQVQKGGDPAQPAAVPSQTIASDKTNNNSGSQDITNPQENHAALSAAENTESEKSSEELESEKQSIEEAVKDSLKKRDWLFKEEQNDWENENLKQVDFKKASDYNYLGVGHYNDIDNKIRDAYIPYGGSVNLSPGIIGGGSHGVHITVGVNAADDVSGNLDASRNRLNRIYPGLKTGKNISIDGEKIEYFKYYDTGKRDDITYKYYGIIYTKQLSDQRYITADIIITPKLFDSDSPKLLEEIKKAYGIDFKNVNDNTGDKWIK